MDRAKVGATVTPPSWHARTEHDEHVHNPAYAHQHHHLLKLDLVRDNDGEAGGSRDGPWKTKTDENIDYLRADGTCDCHRPKSTACHREHEDMRGPALGANVTVTFEPVGPMTIYYDPGAGYLATALVLVFLLLGFP